MTSVIRNDVSVDSVRQRLRMRNTCSEAFLHARGPPSGSQPAGKWRGVFWTEAVCSPSVAGPYLTDAQHVSVEFVHPVIVGKRALPALDISCFVEPFLNTSLRSRRHRNGLRPARGGPGNRVRFCARPVSVAR